MGYIGPGIHRRDVAFRYDLECLTLGVLSPRGGGIRTQRCDGALNFSARLGLTSEYCEGQVLRDINVVALFFIPADPVLDMRRLVFHEESTRDGFANKFFEAHRIHDFFLLRVDIVDRNAPLLHISSRSVFPGVSSRRWWGVSFRGNNNLDGLRDQLDGRLRLECWTAGALLRLD